MDEEEMGRDGIQLTSESEDEGDALGNLDSQIAQMRGNLPLTHSEILRKELPEDAEDYNKGVANKQEFNTQSQVNGRPEQTNANPNDFETECPFSEKNFYRDTNLF